jgi:hypothetical protein
VYVLLDQDHYEQVGDVPRLWCAPLILRRPVIALEGAQTLVTGQILVIAVSSSDHSDSEPFRSACIRIPPLDMSAD